MCTQNNYTITLKLHQYSNVDLLTAKDLKLNLQEIAQQILNAVQKLTAWHCALRPYYSLILFNWLAWAVRHTGTKWI